MPFADKEKRNEYERKVRRERRPSWLRAQKAWRDRNPDKAKQGHLNRYLKRTYGISKEQYDLMVEAQAGLCAICAEPERRVAKNGELQRLSVDHCHATGAVRGLLCDDCNVAISRVRDNPEIADTIAAYLRKTR